MSDTIIRNDLTLEFEDSEEISRQQDAPEAIEAKAWEIISGGWLHHGYFDDANVDASLAEGAERFARMMIDKTSISAGQTFCDLGCGVGRTAIMLAAERGCFVEGVTNSYHQQQIATRRAWLAGLDHLVAFHLEDARDLPFAGESMAGGWFFESISRIGHEKALTEARRVLKSGSTLLIADLYLRGDAQRGFCQYAVREMQTQIIRLQAYREVLADCGFEVVELEDVSVFVGKPFPQKFAEAFHLHRHEIAHLVGEIEVKRWLEVHEIIARNTGYITVAAKAV